MKLIPVVLSGGSGSRLWPLSRMNFPKQFLSLVSDSSMIQDTVSRLSGLSVDSPIVVCNEGHRFVVAEQLAKIGIEKPSILLEPAARNTAPAIVAACLHAMARDKDAVVAVLPADHCIKNTDAFTAAMEKAVNVAQKGSLVTFGVIPTFAATGYGYINITEGSSDGNSLAIERFVEKPDAETASGYLKSYRENGDFFWNSGMFVFRAETLISEMNEFEPEIVANTKKSMENAVVDLDFIRLENDSFSLNKSISIDYAVMERTRKGRVVPLDAGWSDVGSWSSLWDVLGKDEDGNVFRGNVVSDNVKNSFVYGKNRVVAAVGVENVVVVDTKDALLVADRTHAEDVKKIVDSLKEKGVPCATESNVGYRPWGVYETIEFGSRFRVKHITVKPGQKLSVQMHYHRAEHWIVVSGTAKVRNGDKEFILSENQSTFIPLGTVHAIENPGKMPLEFIEVQSGSYLEEDDIVRFEDKYGRC